ncbi:ribonuclease H-like domain-containing protein [Tanacetum coccineum]
MITWSQSGIVKPIDHLSLNTFLISIILKNSSEALKDSYWRNAMYDEYNALIKNGTWLLVPRPAGVNMVCSMWLFKHKFHADRTLSRYKARLVANDSSQQLGVDFDETFSPVVKTATIRIVLSLVVSRKWLIHQLDVKNAFHKSELSETVYIHQPPGFVDARFPNYVCRLQRSLYGLKQAPRAWDLRLLIFFYMWMILFLRLLLQHFSIILLILYIRKYALQILEHAHMVNCNPSRTPVDTESKLGPEGVPVQDPTLYRSLGTLDLGLHLYASSTTSLVGYTDADWAGCPSTRGSTSVPKLNTRVLLTLWRKLHGFVIFLRELHSPLSTATLVYCDNVSAVYMSVNPVQHQRTKHIKIDIHFVRDMVTAGQVRVLHVPSRFQYFDIFTKRLPSALFEEFRSSLSVRPPPAPTVGVY